MRVPFFCILANTYLVFCLFNDSHSDRYDVVSHYGFALYFPDVSQTCRNSTFASTSCSVSAKPGPSIRAPAMDTVEYQLTS